MSALERMAEERDAALAEACRARVGAAFATSAFVRDRLTVPADILAATFGPRFRVEGGRVVGLDEAGAVIGSKARLGEPADFDEVLAGMIDASGYGEQIKRPVAPANGAVGTLNRAEFEALAPGARTAWVKRGGTVTDGDSTPGAAVAAVAATDGPVMRRAAFAAMSPAEQMAHVKARGRVVE